MEFGEFFSKMNYSQLLIKDEVSSILAKLEELKPFYTDLPKKFSFQTLGAASYIHCGDGTYDKNLDLKDDICKKYNEIKAKSNPILMNNFNWIYKKVCKKIYDIYNEEAMVCSKSDLAYPGFHIFYPHEWCEDIHHPPHMDLQSNFHLERLKKIFNTVDQNVFLTFTLSILLPKAGAGLYYWNIPNELDTSLKSAEKFYERLINEITEEYKDIWGGGNSDRFLSKEQFEADTKPNILLYKEGYINIFKGYTLHQIMPFFTPYSMDEKRITLQGHGIKCDGIWRLYF